MVSVYRLVLWSTSSTIYKGVGSVGMLNDEAMGSIYRIFSRYGIRTPVAYIGRPPKGALTRKSGPSKTQKENCAFSYFLPYSETISHSQKS